jgi:hypothetical protein
VKHLDIVTTEFLNTKFYKEEEDPTKTKSIPPLTPNWPNEAKNLMCCYKVLKVNLNLGWPLSGQVENFVGSFQHDVILRFSKQTYCNQLLWWTKTVPQIQKFEQNMFQDTNSAIDNQKL